MGSPATQLDIALLARVVFGRDRSRLGLPVETSRATLAILFPDVPGRPLPGVAEKVRITLTGTDLSGPVEFDAHVMHGAVTDGIARTRFQVIDHNEQALLNIPYRRANWRARVSSSRPVAMEVSEGGDQGPVAVKLHDISQAGLSFRLPETDDRDFPVNEPLSLAFRFAEGEEEIRLVGFVRYRRGEGPTVRYGVRFDRESLENPGLICERIAEYLLANQLATLRGLEEE
jgi:hypothetical protein